MPDGTTELMNRNLGTSPTALQSGVPGLASDGTYYRYGRKEPYFNNNYQGGGTIIGTDGMEETGWDEMKSPTDPCPPGYRIPTSTIWSDTNYNNATKEHSGFKIGNLDFLGFRYWNNGTTDITDGLDYLIDDIYYPYSGYIDAQKSKQNGGGIDSEYTLVSARNFEISDIRTNEQQIGDISYNEVAYVIRYEEKEMGYNEYRYTEFQYHTKLKTNYIGYFHSANNTGVKYYLKECNWEDYNIVQCKRYVRQVKRKDRCKTDSHREDERSSGDGTCR
jgi:hypothetical protein